jgi:hypothetical protein
MARKPKLKKGDQIVYQGRVMFVRENQYLFRNKPVVDLENRSGTVGVSRIPVVDIKIPIKSGPEPITNSILRGTSEPELDEAVQTITHDFEATAAVENTASSVPSLSLGKYDRQIINSVGESIVIDIYDVLDAFVVNDAAVAHAVKKLLAPGQRGNKSVIQDLKEAIVSIERAIERETNKHLRG